MTFRCEWAGLMAGLMAGRGWGGLIVAWWGLVRVGLERFQGRILEKSSVQNWSTSCKPLSGGIVSSRSSSSDSEMTGTLGFCFSSLRGGGGALGAEVVGLYRHHPVQHHCYTGFRSSTLKQKAVPHWNKKLSHSLGVGYEDGFSIVL